MIVLHESAREPFPVRGSALPHVSHWAQPQVPNESSPTRSSATISDDVESNSLCRPPAILTSGPLRNKTRRSPDCPAAGSDLGRTGIDADRNETGTTCQSSRFPGRSLQTGQYWRAIVEDRDKRGREHQLRTGSPGDHSVRSG